MNVRAMPFDKTLPSLAELIFNSPIATVLPRRHDSKKTAGYRDPSEVGIKQKEYLTGWLPLPNLEKQEVHSLEVKA